MKLANQHSAKSASLRFFLFGGQWEFISPLSLDEAIERFQNRMQKDKDIDLGVFLKFITRDRRPRIEMGIIDNDSYTINVVTPKSGRPIVNAAALLSRQNTESTSVNIETHVNLKWFISWAVAVTVFIIAPAIGEPSRLISVWFSSMMVSIYGGLWLFTAVERYQNAIVIRILLQDDSVAGWGNIFFQQMYKH